VRVVHAGVHVVLILLLMMLLLLLLLDMSRAGRMVGVGVLLWLLHAGVLAIGETVGGGAAW